MNRPVGATDNETIGMFTVQGRDVREALATRSLQRTLESVFKRLENANIPYCVLRNRESIPTGLLAGSDVDIIVPTGTTLASLVRAFADLSPVQIIQRREVITFYFPAGDAFLHIDLLYRDQEWLGARYEANDKILQRAWVDDGIPVASHSHQALFGWLHSILWGGFFKDKYTPLILHAVESHGEEFHSLLLDALGPALGDELWKIASSGDLAASAHIRDRIRRTVFVRGLRRHFRSTLAGCLDHYWSELRLRIQPAGITVAILGPDGAGKSTLCQLLRNQSKASWPTPRITLDHLYRPCLPSLYHLRRGRIRSNKTTPILCTDPHGKPPHGPIISTAKLAYSLADQWLSEALWSRHLLAKNHIRLLDRHMMEIRVDPTRYRYGGRLSVARFFSRLVPQPDLIFLLDASPTTLQSRKQEVTFEETIRQREAFLEIVRGLPHGHILNAERDTESIAADARQAILCFLEKRTQRRFLGSHLGLTGSQPNSTSAIYCQSQDSPAPEQVGKSLSALQREAAT